MRDEPFTLTTGKGEVLDTEYCEFCRIYSTAPCAKHEKKKNFAGPEAYTAYPDIGDASEVWNQLTKLATKDGPLSAKEFALLDHAIEMNKELRGDREVSDETKIVAQTVQRLALSPGDSVRATAERSPTVLDKAIESLKKRGKTFGSSVSSIVNKDSYIISEASTGEVLYDSANVNEVIDWLSEQQENRTTEGGKKKIPDLQGLAFTFSKGSTVNMHVGTLPGKAMLRYLEDTYPDSASYNYYDSKDERMG